MDIVALDGDDLSQLPLSIRKHKLRRLPPHGSGILAAPFEQGELGPDLFKAAFQMGSRALCRRGADGPYGRPIEPLDKD